jgi:hypothetical protein
MNLKTKLKQLMKKIICITSNTLTKLKNLKCLGVRNEKQD